MAILSVKQVSVLTPEGFVEKGWGLYYNQYYTWYSRYYRSEESANTIKERFEALKDNGVIFFNCTHAYPFLGA